MNHYHSIISAITPAPIIIQTNESLLPGVIGAFSGSFTAFLFGIVAYDYTKRRERYKLHHDAVVQAEHLANRHLNQISGNIFLLKGALTAYKKNAFSQNILTPIDNPEFQSDFYNLEIKDKYNDYQAFVEKVNHDMLAWNKSNDRMFTAALSGVVSAVDIAKNLKQLAIRTKELISHSEDLMEETYTFGAYIREFLKEDKRPRFARLKPVLNISVPDPLVTKERKIFVKESEATMEKDRKVRLKKYNL